MYKRSIDQEDCKQMMRKIVNKRVCTDDKVLRERDNMV